MTDMMAGFDMGRAKATEATASAGAGRAPGPTEEAQGESTRVVVGWARDGRFCSGSGAPGGVSRGLRLFIAPCGGCTEWGSKPCWEGEGDTGVGGEQPGWEWAGDTVWGGSLAGRGQGVCRGG